MAVLELQFRGIRAMERRLEGLMRRHPRAMMNALRTEAEIELLKMKERTPVEFNVLRTSGRVEDVGTLGIRWVFGGAAEAYAIPVHEDLSVSHSVGQAKFVESVVLEFIPHAAERIGRRWATELGMR